MGHINWTMTTLPTVQEIQACMKDNHTCPAIAFFMLSQHLDYPAALTYYRERIHEYCVTDEDIRAIRDDDKLSNMVVMRSLGVDEPTAELLRSVPYGPDEPHLRKKCYYPTDEEILAQNPHEDVGRLMLMNNMTVEQAWQEYARDQAEFYLKDYYEHMNFEKDTVFGSPHDWTDIKIRATSQGTDTIIVTIHI